MAKQIRLFVLAAAIFWTTAILFAQEQAPVPSFKEGDTWQFNTIRKGQLANSTDQNEGIYELTVTQGVVKIYDVNGGQKNERSVQPDGPTQILLTLVGKSDQQPDLKFPLSVGQKWSYDYETRPPGLPRDQRRSVEVNVTGMEQVTTAAGSFKAYKLVRSASWSTTGPRGGRGGGSTNSSTTTYFYSPETRSIVKSSNANDKNPGTVEIELIKFTPGS